MQTLSSSDSAVLLNELLFSGRGNPEELLSFDTIFPESAGQGSDVGVRLTDTEKWLSTHLKTFGQNMHSKSYNERLGKAACFVLKSLLKSNLYQ